MMSLKTPDKIRNLQRKLYLKAKPDYRFYLLYDKIYRDDIRQRKPMATYRIGCLAVRLFRPDVSGLMSMIG